MEKIANSDYVDFLKFRNDPKNFCLRYGQAFIAWVKLSKNLSITDPKLFYSIDANECIDIIMEKYINLN